MTRGGRTRGAGRAFQEPGYRARVPGIASRADILTFQALRFAFQADILTFQEATLGHLDS